MIVMCNSIKSSKITMADVLELAAARIAIATWQCQQHEPYSFKVETHGH